MEWFSTSVQVLPPHELEKWYNHMSEAKKTRINKLRFDDDKKRSIAGEMLAKKAIADKLHIKPEEINISAKENGKPYAVGLPIEFNISHACDLVVCAINDTPIGIDIEKIHSVNIKIAKRFFTTAEQTYLFGRTPTEEDYDTEPDEAQLTRFFEIWTAKEAFLKYTGQGLAENLSKIDIDKTRLQQIETGSYIISIFR